MPAMRPRQGAELAALPGIHVSLPFGRQKKPPQQRSLQGLELPGGSLVWDENKERESVSGIVGTGST
jgi:hypothetical protein